MLCAAQSTAATNAKPAFAHDCDGTSLLLSPAQIPLQFTSADSAKERVEFEMQDILDHADAGSIRSTSCADHMLMLLCSTRGIEVLHKTQRGAGLN